MENYSDFVKGLADLDNNNKIKPEVKQHLRKDLMATFNNVENIAFSDYLVFVELAMRDEKNPKLQVSGIVPQKDNTTRLELRTGDDANVKLNLIVPTSKKIIEPISKWIYNTNVEDNAEFANLTDKKLQSYVKDKLEYLYIDMCTWRLNDERNGKLQPWEDYFVQLLQTNEDEN